jgi:hypothetical protein
MVALFLFRHGAHVPFALAVHLLHTRHGRPHKLGEEVERDGAALALALALGLFGGSGRRGRVLCGRGGLSHDERRGGLNFNRRGRDSLCHGRRGRGSGRRRGSGSRNRRRR